MSRRILSRLEQQPGRKLPNLFALPRPITAFLGAVAALALLFIVVPHDFFSSVPTERIKGQDPQLKLYRKTPDGSEPLEDGARTFPGDVVRIGYQAAGHAHGVIVAVDGREP